MNILALVDGTGPFSNVEYGIEFHHGVMQRLGRSWGGQGPCQYRRGPESTGWATTDLAADAARFIIEKHGPIAPNAARPGVFLAGYSRGGAAVISACWRLKDEGIEVDCLLLCDAVGRTVAHMQTDIPSNVRTCYHAVRDPDTWSRSWFGNCGRARESGLTDYRERMFFCTHGGVGGVPWLTGGPDGLVVEDGGYAGYVIDYSILRRNKNRVAAMDLVDVASAAYTRRGRTNVTPEMDWEVSKMVWSWISGALASEIGKRAEASRPRLSGPRSDVGGSTS